MEELKESIINHISLNDAAFSKYQQRGEEELSASQKKILAQNLLDKSVLMFLNRFGNLLKKEHLVYFKQLKYEDKNKEDIIQGTAYEFLS